MEETMEVFPETMWDCRKRLRFLELFKFGILPETMEVRRRRMKNPRRCLKDA
ncbi:hypothetical protein HanIR_Chr08g0363261 [Helianthus annuus]|nr:hypothetical protein HanIR_Chr08g0363261 [Helianthus annuus]